MFSPRIRATAAYETPPFVRACSKARSSIWMASGFPTRCSGILSSSMALVNLVASCIGSKLLGATRHPFLVVLARRSIDEVRVHLQMDLLIRPVARAIRECLHEIEEHGNRKSLGIVVETLLKEFDGVE